MKFWTILLNGCPRLDITGVEIEDARQRAAKVLGGREFAYHLKEGHIKFIQVKLEVMV
jgi:hypothetical protein